MTAQANLRSLRADVDALPGQDWLIEACGTLVPLVEHSNLPVCVDLIKNSPQEVVRLDIGRLVDLVAFVCREAGAPPSSRSSLRVERKPGGLVTVVWVTKCGTVSDNVRLSD